MINGFGRVVVTIALLSASALAHARFLQTDPIGTKDDVNLYAYVKNDPSNLIDPTGTTCSQSEGRAYSCQVDAIQNSDGTMTERKDFTAKDMKAVAKFDAAYTAAVNHLADNPDNEVSVSVGGKAEKQNAGSLATTLADRTFVAVPGKSTDLPAGTKSTGEVLLFKKALTGVNGTTVTERSRDSLKQRIMMEIVVHEGMHGPGSISDSLRGPMDLETWNRVHQTPFARAAEELLK